MRPPGTLLTLNCNSNFPAFLSLSNQEKVVSDFSVLTPQSEAILTFDGWTTAPKVCVGQLLYARCLVTKEQDVCPRWSHSP